MYIHVTLRAIAAPVRMFLAVILLPVLNVNGDFACSLPIIFRKQYSAFERDCKTATDSRVLPCEPSFSGLCCFCA